MLVLGIMSGTSMDGIDLSLSDIRIDNNYNIKFNIIDCTTIEYDNKIKDIISNAVFLNKISYDYIDNYLGFLFKDFIKNFLKNREIELICSHGQTISHKEFKYSIQVSNPKHMYDEFQVPIVYNFRSKDIAYGGNGAPLVPFLDWILYKNKDYVICLNIGGISNISIIKPNFELLDVLGFDTGPGMCLIDMYVQRYWNKKYDNNGELSEKGNINYDLLNYLLDYDPFIYIKPPKSMTTEFYSSSYLQKIIKKFVKINKYDFLRTLVNFTAVCISKNIKMVLNDSLGSFSKIIISGGGAKNNLIMSDLKNITKMEIKHIDINGLNIDNKESFLIAVLGLSRYLNMNNTIPRVTGSRKQVKCGEIYE